MDETKALNKISESADLIKMLEELLNFDKPEKFSTVLPGFKITLKNVREAILDGHDTLARSFIAQARQETFEARPAQTVRPTAPSSDKLSVEKINLDKLDSPPRLPNTAKRDLREALEKSLVQG